MSATTSVIHGGRWSVYCVRFVAYAAYGVLVFLSKPGARLIVPVSAAALTWFYRDRLAPLLLDALGHSHLEAMTRASWAAVAAVALCIPAALWGHGERVSAVLGFVRRLLVVLLKLALLAAVGLVVFACTGHNMHGVVRSLMWPFAWCSVHIRQEPGCIVYIALLPAICVYITLSRLLTVLLGAFPPVVRPLAPQKRLSVTGRPLTPVRVRLAVPSLPR